MKMELLQPLTSTGPNRPFEIYLLKRRITKLHRGDGYAFLRGILRVLHAKMRKLNGCDIGQNTRIALSAYIDLTHPRGVHIGDGTLVEAGAVVLAHDSSLQLHFHTHIGRNCLIGARATIMAGVTVGDQSIVLAGSLVSMDVPAGSIVAGSPARVVGSGIRTGKCGVLLDAGAGALANGAERAGPAPAIACSSAIWID